MHLTVEAVELVLRDFALGYPETHEDFPWGHRAIKVRGKVFAFLGGAAASDLRCTVKLPHSREFALEYPFTEVTGYGLGRSGWVTARFADPAEAPIDILQAWIDESFRAVAPKRLGAGVPPRGPAREAADA
jgi:predicted DNA-binding protein (MmcQ/YjbR family)